jgi:hypothetical protein
VNPKTGREARVNRPRTWSNFDSAAGYYHEHPYLSNGIGFVFSQRDPFTGIDLDHCRDAQTGDTADWACEIIHAIGSYAEVSPSRTGVKIIIEGALPDIPGTRFKDKATGARIEIYNASRFFTTTGLRFPGTSRKIEKRQAELEELYAHLCPEDAPNPNTVIIGSSSALMAPWANVTDDDAELVRLACAARNGAKFSRLWNGDWTGYASHSEADMALSRILGHWTGYDLPRVDRLFQMSGLMRPKWDREDYRERTLNALKPTLRDSPAEALKAITVHIRSSSELLAAEKAKYARLKRRAAYERLIDLAWDFQVYHAGGDFPFGLPIVEKAVGCSRGEAWYLRRELCRRGTLVKTEEYYSVRDGIAQKFRFKALAS